MTLHFDINVAGLHSEPTILCSWTVSGALLPTKADFEGYSTGIKLNYYRGISASCIQVFVSQGSTSTISCHCQQAILTDPLRLPCYESESVQLPPLLRPHVS